MIWLIYTVLIAFVPANHYPLLQYQKCLFSGLNRSNHYDLDVDISAYCEYQLYEASKGHLNTCWYFVQH